MVNLDAIAFSQQWVQAWNAHDVDAVLQHFHDDVVFTSPVAAKLLSESRGVLRGKAALRNYWTVALQKIAGLHFAVEGVYQGVDTIVIAYRNHNDVVVSEVLKFDDDNLVIEGHGTYPVAAQVQWSMNPLELPVGLPAPEDDGAAAQLPGERLPAVSLPSTAGDAIALDALGGGRTAIYVYPLTGRPGVELPQGWDAIPGARGCTPEACGFRDHYRELLDAGVRRMFGLSSQDTAYQREVVERLRLPFEMLADPTLALADELGLPTFEADGRRYYKRLTLIVRDGRIEHVFYPVFLPGDHAEQVRDWIHANR